MPHISPVPQFSAPRSDARPVSSGLPSPGSAALRDDGARPSWRPTPLSAALAAALVTGAAAFAAPSAQAASPVGGAWFAAGGAREASRGVRPGLPPGARGDSAQRQQAQARKQLSRSIANLERTATAIAAQQAAQQAARAKAGKQASRVADGLAAGGLVRATGALAQWEGAKAPKETVKGGQHTVAIKQTDPKAILAWESFDVGRKTLLRFDQQASDAVLNKVVGAGARPSRIQGAIQAKGTVLVVNQNGIVFGGTSQVDVRNLVAAATRIDETQAVNGVAVNRLDYQFQANGIYHDAFKVAAGLSGESAGKVRVAQGARIATQAPADSTTGGGYVLLLGKEVSNAGTIAAYRGQAVLAAGDGFAITQGYAVTQDDTTGDIVQTASTTRGNVVVPTGAGRVENAGLILARMGDITLAGSEVRLSAADEADPRGRPAGVLVASTSVDVRGTLHLIAGDGDDAGGKVTLGQGGTAAIVLEDSDVTALDSQRASLLEPVNLRDRAEDIVRADAYRRDLSLVEIASSGTVDFERGSLALATGGQIAVRADQRALVRQGAQLDVSGEPGVRLSWGGDEAAPDIALVSVPMSINNLQINIQGNEQRDAPVNRDGKNLNNSDVWIDRRLLVRVAADGSYATDRWYTAGGLLEVGGYLGLQGHTVGEWMAQGGTVSFGGGGDVVTQSGSRINLSGGVVNVEGGYMNQSWLRGSDGRLYTADRAPGDLLYAQGLYRGYEDHHARWDQTRYFRNPLLGPPRRWEAGYTVGRDAGTLIVATPGAVLEGELLGKTYQGPRQTEAAQARLDGYLQGQSAAARGARLVVGGYDSYYLREQKRLEYALRARLENVILAEATEKIADALDLDTALPEDRQHTLVLDTARLTGYGLGSIAIAATDVITVDGALQTAPAGGVAKDGTPADEGITLHATQVDVNADLVSHGGTIRLGNMLEQVIAAGVPGEGTVGETRPVPVHAGTQAGVAVAEGVRLDASGLWTNLLRDTDAAASLPYRHGGLVSIRSAGDVTLGAGSLIDVSSGAAIGHDGSRMGGRGGRVELQAGGFGDNTRTLRLDGDIHGYGVDGSGTLSIRTANSVVLGDGGQWLRSEGWLQAGEAAPLVLDVLIGKNHPLPIDAVYGKVMPGQTLASDVVIAGITDFFTAGSADQSGLIVVPAGGWDLRGTSLIVKAATINATTGVITVASSNVVNGTTVWGGADATRHTVPAGTKIARINAAVGTTSGTLGGGYTIPDFVPEFAVRDYTVAKGDPAPFDTVLTVPAGTRALERVAVLTPPPFVLSQALFQGGFANYEVTARQGVLMPDNARLSITRPAYRFTEDSAAYATGRSPAQALALWTPPRYIADAASGTLVQRAGASLSVQAGDNYSPNVPLSLVIGRDAHIEVDPGQTIALSSPNQLTVEGRLDAWSGEIVLSNNLNAGKANRQEGSSFWIGEHAVLDVAGRAMTRIDAAGNVVSSMEDGSILRDQYGRRYGIVDAGGSIVIGGAVDPNTGSAPGLSQFLVIRPGALLDASGAGAVLDVPSGAARVVAGLGAPGAFGGAAAQRGYDSVPVAGAGGSIVLASGAGLYLDGDMRAHAGGAGAAGGSLQVATGIVPIVTSSGASSVTGRQRALRELVVSQYQGADELAGLALDEAADQMVYGRARVSAEQVYDGGFDTLTLHSGGMIAFDGKVDLRLGQAINLYAGSLGWAGDATTRSTAVLAAPYMRLAGSMAPVIPEGVTGVQTVGMHYGASVGGFGAATSLFGELTLRAGRLLDVAAEAGLGFGGKLSVTNPPSEPALDVDRHGFERVSLVSGGDMRFFGRSNGLGSTLTAPGELTLAAAQIYPVTNAIANVNAVGTLTVARTTRGIPAMPYSVGGLLRLYAPTIDQGGILRAPQGSLILGNAIGSDGTQQVNLLDRSITSVSTAGLSMPYGGTVDGLLWNYDGKQVGLQGVGGGAGIRLQSLFVDVQEGAVIDISGGGELTGAGFVSGRGGSVDARYSPLVQSGRDGFALPGLDTNPVYAIVPRNGQAVGQAAAAPAKGEAGASTPLLGQQVYIGAGVPGLAPGYYTLLPSTYALLPGAFRVEINGAAGQGAATRTARMRNGSWMAPGVLSVGGAGIRNSLASQLILTPADVLRTYSQYNETSFLDFARADAARLGVPRALTEIDAKTLTMQFRPRGVVEGEADAVNFSFHGTLRGEAAEGGYGNNVVVMPSGNFRLIEILGDDSAPMWPLLPGVSLGTPTVYTPQVISLPAADLSRLGADRLLIGAEQSVTYGQNGRQVSFSRNGSNSTDGILLRSGAQLSAAEVMLLASTPVAAVQTPSFAIEIEPGAVISTLGQGDAPYGAHDVFVYNPGTFSVVVASNGLQQWQAPEKGSGATDQTPARISIGTCPAGSACTGTTRLYSEGSLNFATAEAFVLDSTVRLGTRHLTLASQAFNIGDTAAAAGTLGTVPTGLTMDQSTLSTLVRGDESWGAPALETLELVANQSVNFFGSTTLSTLGDAGRQAGNVDNLLLTTPAIYGYGEAGDVARIQTSHLIWNGALGGWDGSASVPGAYLANGAGSGAFRVDAERITFGYGPDSQPDGVSTVDRLILGFAGATFAAADRITANNNGTLAVYQSQAAYDPDAGPGAYSGGNLDLVAPLLTGEAGSVNRITAGGTITVSAPGSGTADPAGVSALGAEIALAAGKGLQVDTTVALPSGKLTLQAEGNVALGSQAHLDLAGRAVAFFDDVDATQYSWGGDATLESTQGNVTQAAGSTIDLSARHNQAGRLTAMALAEGVDAARVAAGRAGVVDLQGGILGGASGRYDAGGTYVPYASGGIVVRAQRLGTGGLDELFAALNRRLNDGEVHGLRSFQIKQGDLAIGNVGDGRADIERNLLKASQVEVSIDDGRLTVAGRIDASGERVGSIRLAGKAGLTLTGQAELDAHGSLLRVDSHGYVIDAPNRAIVELNAGTGTLTLAPGASIDLRHGTDDARYADAPELRARMRARGPLGTVDLIVPRTGETSGDLRISAGGDVAIQGARSIAVYANQRYDDSDADAASRLHDGSDAAGGRPYRVVDQAYLDAKHARSVLFMDNAVAGGALSGALQGKLAGLSAYEDAFHLRPGVEIASERDIVVLNDLDLSAHRYASVNPRVDTAGLGAGESGALALRAGGDLNIYGSINDGFAPPPGTPDDDGWLLTRTDYAAGAPRGLAFNSEIVVSRTGLVLAHNTAFRSGKTLNYDLPIQSATMIAGTRLPVEATVLDHAAGTNGRWMSFAAGTVLTGDITVGGTLYRAGSVLQAALTVAPGDKLGAGIVLSENTKLDAMVWPAGVALPRTIKAAFTALPTNAGPSLGTPATAANIGTVADIVLLDAPTTGLAIKVGGLLPAGTGVLFHDGSIKWDLRAPDADGNHGRNWAVAGMLPEGAQSWNMRLVAGADLQAADPRLTVPAAGRLQLADTHYGIHDATASTSAPRYYPVAQNFSVVRTGTGDLELIAGGDVAIESLYGIYTAGTDTSSAAGAQQGDFNRKRGKTVAGNVVGAGTAAAPITMPGYEALVDGADAGQSTYAAWYPDGGGNLLLRAGGDLTGDMLGAYTTTPSGLANDVRNPRGSAEVGNWLWRQGSGGTEVVQDIPTSWWINFGTYAVSPTPTGSNSAYTAAFLGPSVASPGTVTSTNYVRAIPELVGFTGIGTLGGGNLTVDVGGNAGMLARSGDPYNSNQLAFQPRSQGLILAVGGTGRVLANGDLRLTGGGDIGLRIGGDLNPGLAARAYADKGTASDFYQSAQPAINTTGIPNERKALPLPADAYIYQNLDLTGVFANLRGALDARAGEMGGIALNYTRADPREMRAYDVNKSSVGTATGGAVLMLGDAAATLATRGDLVVSGSGDPGRVALPMILGYTASDGTAGANGFSGRSWFSLWTDRTAIDLFAAGGDLTPSVQLATTGSNLANGAAVQGRNYSPTDDRFVWPSQLGAVAASGNVYMGPSALGTLIGKWNESQQFYTIAYSMLLAPSASGRLAIMAGDSLYAGGYTVSQSGASADALPTPSHPAFAVFNAAATPVLQPALTNLDAMAIPPAHNRFPIFVFGRNTASGRNAGPDAARFYAREGDIVGLSTGAVITLTRGSGAAAVGDVLYESGGPVWMRAGRDIVRSGDLQNLVKQDAGSDSPENQNNPAKPTYYEVPIDRLLQPAYKGTQALGAGASLGDDLLYKTPTSTAGKGSYRAGLIVHADPADVSVVWAGRDILLSSFSVAGPGTLEVSAGRNITMAGVAGAGTLNAAAMSFIGGAAFRSLGTSVIVPGDLRPGADIVVQAGLGPRGMDGASVAAFLDHYLDRGNLAQVGPGNALADQPGKVVRTYDSLSLEDWLRSEYGYRGEADGSPESFLAGLQARYSAANPGARTSLRQAYEQEAASAAYLDNWLAQRYGAEFDPAGTDAVAFLKALPPEQQRVFARQIYFSELRAAGREYNNSLSPRAGSYLRGRQAIAGLFPLYDTGGDWAAQIQSGLAAEEAIARNPDFVQDPNSLSYARKYGIIENLSYAGKYDPIPYGWDDGDGFGGGSFIMHDNAGRQKIVDGRKSGPSGWGHPETSHEETLYANAHVRTLFGGDVQFLTPSGNQIFGVEGLAPSSLAGVITQGRGRIQLYSQGSILLGQSRIMTTFGGDIFGWSGQGDINAGRGAKTTIVYTPPKREYDGVGNVQLSSSVPSSGAGIATLAPIAEVPPGDMDLIAPLGTIDAGEAGIRVSGNLNIAALHVVNAANIQVQGEAVGIPVVAAVNVGALTNASAAASSAATAAADTVSRARAQARQNLPSIISVQILGFGNGPANLAPPPAPGAAPGGPRAEPSAYRPASAVQVLGDANMGESQRNRLTAAERQSLGL